MNGEENFGLWKNLWKTRKSAEPANMVIFAGADAELLLSVLQNAVSGSSAQNAGDCILAENERTVNKIIKIPGKESQLNTF